MEEKKIKRLYRSRRNRIIFGFCGGLGEYFGIDPVIIRIIYVLLMLMQVGGLVLLIFYILVPLFVALEPADEQGSGNVRS